MGFKYQGTLYLYRKDIQGNIIAVLSEYGGVQFTYEYDAWGNFEAYDASGNKISTSGRTSPTSAEPTKLCDKNPFKYRGYFYDWQTGLYYLQSRYYDPSTGRFISVDSFGYAAPEETDGLNLYAYCKNNPVMYIDPTGHGILAWLFGILLIGGAITGGIIAGVNGNNIGLGILEGAFTGLFLYLSICLVWNGLGIYAANKILGTALMVGGISSAFAMGTNLDEQRNQGNYFGGLNFDKVAFSWLKGFAAGALTGAFGGAFNLYGQYGAGLLMNRLGITGNIAAIGNLLGGGVFGFLSGLFFNYIFTESNYLSKSIPIYIATILGFLFKR